MPRLIANYYGALPDDQTATKRASGTDPDAQSPWLLEIFEHLLAREPLDTAFLLVEPTTISLGRHVKSGQDAIGRPFNGVAFATLRWTDSQAPAGLSRPALNAAVRLGVRFEKLLAATHVDKAFVVQDPGPMAEGAMPIGTWTGLFAQLLERGAAELDVPESPEVVRASLVTLLGRLGPFVVPDRSLFVLYRLHRHGGPPPIAWPGERAWASPDTLVLYPGDVPHPIAADGSSVDATRLAARVAARVDTLADRQWRAEFVRALGPGPLRALAGRILPAERIATFLAGAVMARPRRFDLAAVIDGEASLGEDDAPGREARLGRFLAAPLVMEGATRARTADGERLELGRLRGPQLRQLLEWTARDAQLYQSVARLVEAVAPGLKDEVLVDVVPPAMRGVFPARQWRALWETDPHTFVDSVEPLSAAALDQAWLAILDGPIDGRLLLGRAESSLVRAGRTVRLRALGAITKSAPDAPDVERLAPVLLADIEPSTEELRQLAACARQLPTGIRLRLFLPWFSRAVATGSTDLVAAHAALPDLEDLSLGDVISLGPHLADPGKRLPSVEPAQRRWALFVWLVASAGPPDWRLLEESAFAAEVEGLVGTESGARLARDLLQEGLRFPRAKVLLPALCLTGRPPPSLQLDPLTRDHIEDTFRSRASIALRDASRLLDWLRWLFPYARPTDHVALWRRWLDALLPSTLAAGAFHERARALGEAAAAAEPPWLSEQMRTEVAKRALWRCLERHELERITDWVLGGGCPDDAWMRIWWNQALVEFDTAELVQQADCMRAGVAATGRRRDAARWLTLHPDPTLARIAGILHASG
jgi:hypothetical protein